MSKSAANSSMIQSWNGLSNLIMIRTFFLCPSLHSCILQFKLMPNTRTNSSRRSLCCCCQVAIISDAAQSTFVGDEITKSVSRKKWNNSNFYSVSMQNTQLTRVGTHSLKAGTSTFPCPTQICHSVELVIDLAFPVNTEKVAFHSHEYLPRKDAQEG